MIIPEFLYRLLSGDQGVQTLDVVHKEVTTALASASIQADTYTVPKDRAFVLLNSTLQLTPGAAQNVVRQRTVFTPIAGGQDYSISIDTTAGGVAAQHSSSWQGQVWIPPGGIVQVVGVFNAGANVNTIVHAIHGISIPRGTFTWSV